MAGPRTNEDIRHEELLRALSRIGERHHHAWAKPHPAASGEGTRLFQECRGCGKVRQVSR